MRRLVFTVSTVAALASISTASIASPGYPPFIATQPGATCAPECTVCHATDSGGAGTVVQPFGKALVMLGLVGENTSSLVAALGAAKAENLDVNCNGVPDVEELLACMNPNAASVGDDASACGGADATADPVPQYGCAVARRPRGALADGCGAGVLAALGLLAWRRRGHGAPRRRA
jgi:hypothetical protein